jgi:hypothetical protein
VSSLYARAEFAPGAGVPAKQWTFTIFKNGLATTLSCLITTLATECSDTIDTVTFVAGDKISIQIDADNNPVSNSAGSWSVKFS